jgi:aspartate aminotransferase
LHACAHNPTGVDPKPEQWAELSQLLLSCGHLPFFDMAYQGFASGDPARDAAAVRQFVSDGHLPLVAQSYAKNFGLYGERVGALSVVCRDAEERARVESRLKIVVRPMYSNPPIHGARIVATVLKDTQLKDLWASEVRMMASRIIAMRSALKSELQALGSSRNWAHITEQIGMFCYTGLNVDQVTALTRDHHVYLTKDGRISIAGINAGNVAYLASAMHQVTK